MMSGSMPSYWAARWQREKDMTPLRDVLIGQRAKEEPERPQTPDEMQAAFDRLVIMTGGTLGGGKKRRRRRKSDDQPAQDAG
jgi:hypothetical protein